MIIMMMMESRSSYVQLDFDVLFFSTIFVQFVPFVYIIDVLSH